MFLLRAGVRFEPDFTSNELAVSQLDRRNTGVLQFRVSCPRELLVPSLYALYWFRGFHQALSWAF